MKCLQFVTFFSSQEYSKYILSLGKKRKANSINISLGEAEENHRLLSLSHASFRSRLLTAHDNLDAALNMQGVIQSLEKSHFLRDFNFCLGKEIEEPYMIMTN